MPSGPLAVPRGACGGESVCTPDSVEDGHPSRPAVARRLQRSTRELDGPPAPCLTLLQVGFTEPSGSPRTLVRSYRTVAPLPVPGEPGHRRSVLCGTVLRVAPTGCYPAPCPVESGRSSDGSSPYATIQPAHHRRGIIARQKTGPGRTGIPTRGARPMGRDSSAETAGVGSGVDGVGVAAGGAARRDPAPEGAEGRGEDDLAEDPGRGEHRRGPAEETVAVVADGPDQDPDGDPEQERADRGDDAVRQGRVDGSTCRDESGQHVDHEQRDREHRRPA